MFELQQVTYLNEVITTNDMYKFTVKLFKNQKYFIRKWMLYILISIYKIMNLLFPCH